MRSAGLFSRLRLYHGSPRALLHPLLQDPVERKTCGPPGLPTASRRLPALSPSHALSQHGPLSAQLLCLVIRAEGVTADTTEGAVVRWAAGGCCFVPVAPGEAAPEPPEGRAAGLLASGAGPRPPEEAAAVCQRPRWCQKPFTVRPLVLSGSAGLSSCAPLQRTVLQGCPRPPPRGPAAGGPA